MLGQDTSHATIKALRYEGGTIGRYLAVIRGSSDDQVKLPTGANLSNFMGFTMLSGAVDTDQPIHISGGIALATAKSAIAAGDRLRIADVAGKVEPVDPTAATNHIVAIALGTAGADGDVFPVHIVPSSHGSLGAGSITKAMAKVFFSAEQTGSGGAQNVAHTLGATPAGVLLVPTAGHDGAGNPGNFAPVLTEGAHTNVNVIATVSNGAKYKVFAWA